MLEQKQAELDKTAETIEKGCFYYFTNPFNIRKDDQSGRLKSAQLDYILNRKGEKVDKTH